MAFTEGEAAYLRAHGFGRLATVDRNGQPDVVPVAIEFDGVYFWVGGAGQSVTDTRKFRNVASGQEKVALVIDDIVSFDPFIARGIRIYGVAEQPFDRDGMIGPGTFMRIAPRVSWSWNLDAHPAPDTWYETRKTVHPHH